MSDEHLRNLPVPFYSQRKNEYIWREKYTDSKEAKKAGKAIGDIVPNGKQVSMASNSCNITSVWMVLRYYGVPVSNPDAIMKSYFAHPLYFINHFEKCGAFEFNPYAGLTYKGVKVVDNPGFAPYLGEGKGINGYAQMTWEFNGTTTADGGTTYHAGLDFAISFSECNKIPIHSLIQGKVVAAIDYGNTNFGNCIIIRSSLNSTYYYIVAHMSKTKPSLKVGDDVFPGKVVGYVGNTGKQYTSWYRTAEGDDKQRDLQLINESDRQYGYGAHLHVQFINYTGDLIGKDSRNNDALKLSVNSYSYNPIYYSDKWKGKK